MNDNILIGIEDVLSTYISKYPRKSSFILKRLSWIPLYRESKLAEDAAYIIGKITGDGNLDKKYTVRFIGQIEDLEELKKIMKKIMRRKRFELS